MNRTSIEWTDFSSNPIYALNTETGKRGWFCTHVSEGCENCYAARLNAGRFGNGLDYIARNRKKVEWRLDERELARILRRRKPARIFGQQGDIPENLWVYKQMPDWVAQ